MLFFFGTEQGSNRWYGQKLSLDPQLIVSLPNLEVPPFQVADKADNMKFKGYVLYNRTAFKKKRREKHCSYNDGSYSFYRA